MSFYQTIRKLKKLYTPLLPTAFKCVWFTQKIFKIFPLSHSKYKVLFIAQNSVALNHIKDIDTLLSKRTDYELYATTDWFPAREIKNSDIESSLSAEYIHVLLALMKLWDLIIYVNHPFGFGIWFSPSIKKLYINHGLHTGKINNTMNEDGVYGPSRINRPFNTPLYSKIFVASAYERRLAERINPQLNTKLIVTGFVKADKFLNDYSNAKHDCRKSLEISGKEYVIHLISTWGKHSLIQKYHNKLLGEIRCLPGRYKVILSIHPRHDEFKEPYVASRKEIFQTFENMGVIVNDSLNWQECIAASDIAISDHSSLFVYHLLLGNKVVFIEVPESEYIPGSSFDWWYQQTCKYKYTDSLVDVLKREINYSQQGAVDIERIINFKGEAEEKYLMEIVSILSLNKQNDNNLI